MTEVVIGRSQEKPEWEFVRSLTLAGTVLASALGTYAIHERYEEPNIDILYPTSDEVVDRQISIEKPDGNPFVESVDIDTPGDLQTETSIEFRYPDAEYARNFDEDPSAQVVDRPAAQEIGRVVGNLQSQGWTVKLEITGSSSAEDESISPDGGTRTRSQRNIDLADTRRDAFVDHLDDSGVISNDVEIVKMPGHEGELSPAQYSILEDLAGRFGYATPSIMIDQWNLEQPVPFSVERTLDAWLKSDRSVIVALTATRDVPGEGDSVEEMVCIIPVRTIETKYVHREDGADTVAIPAFVIIPIPIVRRRRPLYDEDRISILENSGDKEIAEHLRIQNERHLYPRRLAREARAARRQARAQYKEQVRQAKALRKAKKEEPKGSVAAAGSGIVEEPATGDKSTREKRGCLPLRPFLIGAAVIGLTFGFGAILSNCEGGDEKHLSPAGDEATPGNPYCPPGIPEVERNTGNTERRTVYTN